MKKTIRQIPVQNQMDTEMPGWKYTNLPEYLVCLRDHQMESAVLKVNQNRRISIDTERTGNKIKQLCMERGFSVRRIQERLSIGGQSVYAWFEGKSLPNLDNIYLLSRMLDVSIDQMIVGTDKETCFILQLEKTQDHRAGNIVLKYIAKEILKT